MSTLHHRRHAANPSAVSPPSPASGRLEQLRARVWNDGTRRRLRPALRLTDIEPTTGFTWEVVAAFTQLGLIGPNRRERIVARNGFPVPTVASLRIGGGK
jgi:hypothetical protein